MHSQRLVLQDSNTGQVSQIFRSVIGLAGEASFQRLRVAVAYASLAGCRDLVGGLTRNMRRWRGARKEWLVSIDFGRTEPQAVDFLRHLTNSAVRVPDAQNLLQRKLVPERCFHAKSFIFTEDLTVADGGFGLFTGSANLTLSGLHTGVEHGVALLWKPPRRRAEQSLLAGMQQSLKWWDDAWQRADIGTSSLIADYRRIRPVPAREDAAGTVRMFTSSTATEIAAAEGLPWAQSRCLWAQTYSLYQNRGPGRPGNQLDLRRGTRVYFGLTPSKVPPDTKLGEVLLQYGEGPSIARSVRFANNHMDKVNLPVPGEGGPPSYDNTYVHFERLGPGRFKIIVPRSDEWKAWISESRRQGMLYEFTGGRKYGFYN